MDDTTKESIADAPVELDALIAALRHADLVGDATVLKVAKINLLCYFYDRQGFTEVATTQSTRDNQHTRDNRYVMVLAEIARSLKLENSDLYYRAVEKLKIGWPQDPLLKTVWCLKDATYSK